MDQLNPGVTEKGRNSPGSPIDVSTISPKELPTGVRAVLSFYLSSTKNKNALLYSFRSPSACLRALPQVYSALRPRVIARTSSISLVYEVWSAH